MALNSSSRRRGGGVPRRDSCYVPPVPPIPSPSHIAQELSARVIGQETAIRELSIGLSKKLSGLPVGNVLMIGSSGTGKTTLMRAVESWLEAHPELELEPTVVRMHANVLGEEAERGHSGAAILHRLLSAARTRLGADADPQEIVARAGRGIVFVDEVDKIRTQVGDRVNTTGIRAQEALLTVIENEAVPVELPHWAGGDTVSFDSSGLLFVCGGAFEGLYDSVFDRVTVGRDKGALQPTTVMEDGRITERLEFHLRDWLDNEDLFDYGMSPQFLSRFDAVVLLEDLGVDELVRIFLEMPDSGYRRAVEYFASRGFDLALSPAAVRRIAAEAAKQPRLGARALRGVFRRVMRDLEFEPEKAAGPNGAILLDESDVAERLGG